MKRKGISTSIIRADIEKIDSLPSADLYELTFFKSCDIDKLKKFLSKRGKPFGIHLPFVFRYLLTHPQPTTLDDVVRNDTYDTNLESAQIAKKLGAEYVILHFPSAKQKDSWKNNHKLFEECIEHIEKLNGIVNVRIENVYMNDDFHSAEDYIWVLKESKTKMCIDIGHLLIDSKIYSFDAAEFIEKLADYTVEFHIYYADIVTYEKCHHAPWGDSKEFRKLLEILYQFDNVDFVIEPSNDCPEKLPLLLNFWEGL